MASYFRQVPNLEYISRVPNAKISDYDTVKNLFKRVKLSDDVYQDLTYFTKYQIKGEDRPDNVANDVYDDPTLDWLILLANNIVHVQYEWPMNNLSFHNYLIEKYGSESQIESVHHYETKQAIASDGKTTILPKGLEVPEKRYDYRKKLIDGTTNSTYKQEVPYFIEYYDTDLATEVLKTGITSAITNYMYEELLQEKKRNIFILKPEYMNVIFTDISTLMKYKKGSTQFVSETLTRGENIRLYQ